jgi:hypothetical protein
LIWSGITIGKGPFFGSPLYFRRHKAGPVKVPGHVQQPQKITKYNIIFGGPPAAAEYNSIFGELLFH